MPATPNVVRMQDIESGDLSSLFVSGKPGKRLHGKERIAGFRIKLVLLGEGNTVADYLIPNREAYLNVFGRVGYDFERHSQLSST